MNTADSAIEDTNKSLVTTMRPEVGLLEVVWKNSTTNKESASTCTATLIRQKYVLTMRQCVINDTSQTKFVSASFSRKSPKAEGSKAAGQEYIYRADVKAFKPVTSGFKSDTESNEWAVIQLQKPINAEKAKAVCLAQNQVSDTELIEVEFYGAGQFAANQDIDGLVRRVAWLKWKKNDAIGSLPGDSGGPLFSRDNRLLAMITGRTLITTKDGNKSSTKTQGNWTYLWDQARQQEITNAVKELENVLAPGEKGGDALPVCDSGPATNLPPSSPQPTLPTNQTELPRSPSPVDKPPADPNTTSDVKALLGTPEAGATYALSTPVRPQKNGQAFGEWWLVYAVRRQQGKVSVRVFAARPGDDIRPQDSGPNRVGKTSWYSWGTWYEFNALQNDQSQQRKTVSGSLRISSRGTTLDVTHTYANNSLVAKTLVTLP